MTDPNTEAMELWRDIKLALAFLRVHKTPVTEDQAVTAIIGAKLAELRAENEMLKSRWKQGAGPDDWRGCPGQCGESCCGYHEICRQALEADNGA